MEIAQHALADLEIAATRRSPYVVFDLERSYLAVKGTSLLEDPGKFYSPVYKILESYHLLQKEKILIEIDLLQMSSGTLTALYSLCKRICRLSHQMSIIVNWYCDPYDADLIEIVNDISEILQLDIRIIFR